MFHGLVFLARLVCVCGVCYPAASYGLVWCMVVVAASAASTLQLMQGLPSRWQPCGWRHLLCAQQTASPPGQDSKATLCRPFDILLGVLHVAPSMAALCRPSVPGFVCVLTGGVPVARVHCITLRVNLSLW